MAILYTMPLVFNPATGMDQNFLNEQGIERHNPLGLRCFDFIDASMKKNNSADDRSNIYTYKVAKAPQFHPYNSFLFSNPIFMHLAADKISLPNTINLYLQRKTAMPLSKIDFFLVVQENTMDLGQPLLYRPHYYTDQNIPENGMGDYNKTWHTSVALFNLLPNQTNEVHQALFPKLVSVSLINSRHQRVSETEGAAVTHTGGDDIIVLSGPLEGEGIGLEDLGTPNNSSAFWTTLIIRAEGQQSVEKIAVTLHIILGVTSSIPQDRPPFLKTCDFLSSQYSISVSDVAKYLDLNFFGFQFDGDIFQNQGYVTSILSKNKGFADLNPSRHNFFLTDPNWVNGIARNWAGFFVPNTLAFRSNYNIGNFVILMDNKKREIKNIISNGEYLNIYVEGEPLDSNTVGFPSQFIISDTIDDNFFLTDENWMNGVARNGTGFFVPNTPFFTTKYKIGNTVIFCNKDTRIIIGVKENGPYLNVALEGDPLNINAIGIPSKFRVT